MDSHTKQMARKARWSAWAAVLLILVIGAKVSGVAETIWSQRIHFEIWSHIASCQNNLKQMGLVFKMYANESQGEKYPELSSEAGKLMFDGTYVVSEYVPNTEIFACPGVGDPLPEELVDDKYYVYTGYLLMTDEDVLGLAEAYSNQIVNGGDFSENLPGAPSYPYPDEGFIRLREGVERFMITDINNPGGSAEVQSTIPVMWDWPDNHQQGWGGNVLYMDGHVEWQPYPGEFPMTETCINTLAALANYEPPNSLNLREWSEVYSQEQDPTGYKSGFVATCQNNLNQLGWRYKYFSNNSSGNVYPLMSSESGRLMFSAEEMYPDYLENETILHCPGPAPSEPISLFDDQHFVYLSHLLLNDDDVQSFAAAYPGIIAGGGDFSEDIPAPASYGDGDVLRRLREGIERFYITDINQPAQSIHQQSKTPLMIEWPDNHPDASGGNVLFMDGHVEWMEYPGEFPMTEATISALAALAGHAPVTEWRESPPRSNPDIDPYKYLNFCGGNLNRLNWGAKAFANYNTDNEDGVYPLLSPIPGNLMFTEDELPFITFEDIFACPGTTVEGADIFFEDEHYLYLGYALTNDDDVLSFIDAYNAEMLGDGDFSGDLIAESSYGDAIYRLKDFYRYGGPLIVDGADIFEQQVFAHEIPVFIEWPDHHEGLTGGHVVFLDGHREWIDYPGKFPMTESTMNALATLTGYVPTTDWANKGYTLENDSYMRALCALNMNQINTSFRTYENMPENQVHPALSESEGQLMMTDPRYFHFHLFDLERLNCPGSVFAYEPPQADDHSYAYLGYAVRDEDELARFQLGYNQQIDVGGDFLSDLLEGDDTVYRLDDEFNRTINYIEGYPWYTLQYTAKPFPTLIEWPDNHSELRGGNVVFSNGYVEWMEYPGEFPMSETAMDILTELAGRSGVLPILDPEIKDKAKDVFFNFRHLNNEHDRRLDLEESGLTEYEFNQLDLDGDDLLSIPELLRTAVGPTGQRKIVYVDFEHLDEQSGTPNEPFDSLFKGANYVSKHGRVCMRPGHTNEAVTISGAMTLERYGESGVVRIGVNE